MVFHGRRKIAHASHNNKIATAAYKLREIEHTPLSSCNQQRTYMDCGALALASNVFYFILLVSAITILIVLSCFVRRKNLGHGCCDGRPGLYTLVDLLHRGPNRLIYATIFGAMSTDLLILAFGDGGDSFCHGNNPYSRNFCNVVVGNALLILTVGVFYGPLFACVDASRPLLGHVAGLLYLLFLILTIELDGAKYYISECSGVDDAEISLAFLGSLPSYFFYLVLIIWFLYQIVQDIVFKMRGVYISRAHKKNAYLINYTRQLLRKSERATVDSGWIKYVWIHEKGFRFPLQFLAPLVVMISLNFQLFFNFIWIGYYLSVLDPLIELYADIESVILTVSIFAGLVAMVVCGVLLLQFVTTVHKHLKLAAQGKFKFYTKTLPSHATILVNSLKYGGHQIGYFVWAWLIVWIVSFVILGLIIALFVALKKYPDLVGPRVFQAVLTLIWVPLILLAGRVMCKFVFLENDSNGKFIAITNKNGFNIFSYFMFLYNAILGFVAAIVRVLLSMLFGTLLLFRLDRNIMMDGFKFADFGHKKYLGFLYVEHTYNNPVVNTFVALLTDEFEDGGGTGERHSLKVRNRRVHNRWLVAYTLINNPSLCPLRASQLQSKDNNHSTQLEGRNKDYPTALESKTSEYPTLTSDYSTLSSEYPSQSNVYSTQLQTREY